MKVVFMGTPEFAAASLRKLIEEGYEIPLVVTQPDRRGNRNKLILSPVKELAISFGLEVAQPQNIKGDADFIERLRELSPDLIVVAAFGQILPKSVLDIPGLGCINVHGSLLPKLRGASPMQSAILEGLTTSGVTIMRMNEGLDTGDIISKVSVDIEGKYIDEVSTLLAESGADLMAMTIPMIADGMAAYKPQRSDEATYSGLIKKIDGFTDFRESAVQIERKIRAYADWPSCYTYIDDGLQLKLYRAEVVQEDSGQEPGTVSSVGKNSYVISCAEGSLRVLEQQLQGKKRMSAGDFLRGHKLEPGDRFCAEEVK